MDEQTLWTQIASYGVGGILAGIMFWFYQKREKEHKEFAIDCMQDKEVQNNVLVTVVKENTAAVTKNTTVIEALHKRLDGEFRHYRDQERTNLTDNH